MHIHGSNFYENVFYHPIVSQLRASDGTQSPTDNLIFAG